MVSDVLHGGVWYQRRRPAALSLDRDVCKHSEPKFLFWIGDFDAHLSGPGLRIHLRIDVADLPLPRRIRKRLRRNGGTRTDTDAREILLVEVCDDPDCREIDDREQLRGRVHVQTGICGAFGDDAGDRGEDCGDGAHLLAKTEIGDRRWRQAEQFEPRFGALDRRESGRVLRMKPLQFLTAGRSDLDQLPGALQLALVRLQFCASRDEPCLCLCQLRAEDFRQGLPAPHRLAQFRLHARHAATDKRSDHDLLVRVRLNDAWQAQRGCVTARRYRRDDDSRALNRLRRQCDDDVRRGGPGGWR